mmetsp:Transcript_20025/g.59684  ORF Transcript_20025/g.59684 Transcript_20025/m.59684 type:complete len:292 (+) Transcript_20025:1143-2018(+)
MNGAPSGGTGNSSGSCWRHQRRSAEEREARRRAHSWWSGSDRSNSYFPLRAPKNTEPYLPNFLSNTDCCGLDKGSINASAPASSTKRGSSIDSTFSGGVFCKASINLGTWQLKRRQSRVHTSTASSAEAPRSVSSLMHLTSASRPLADGASRTDEARGVVDRRKRRQPPSSIGGNVNALSSPSTICPTVLSLVGVRPFTNTRKQASLPCSMRLSRSSSSASSSSLSLTSGNGRNSSLEYSFGGGSTLNVSFVLKCSGLRNSSTPSAITTSVKDRPGLLPHNSRMSSATDLS